MHLEISVIDGIVKIKGGRAETAFDWVVVPPQLVGDAVFYGLGTGVKEEPLAALLFIGSQLAVHGERREKDPNLKLQVLGRATELFREGRPDLASWLIGLYFLLIDHDLLLVKHLDKYFLVRAAEWPATAEQLPGSHSTGLSYVLWDELLLKALPQLVKDWK